mmetsp:Transcript_28373/g.40397  ORF Transcript_28373/g.40397 Transcript_28373/m.40397 type:complete len:418 (-) Transcript_28373:549-1802(-)
MPKSTNIEAKGEHIKTWMDAWVAGGNFPAMMVGVYDNSGTELFYHSSKGLDTNGNRIEYTRDTIFKIFSMTKPITAVAVMMLMDQGIITIDDPVEKYIPAFKDSTVFVGGTADEPITEPLHTPITLRHLLTHTSGISYGLFGNHPCDIILQRSVPNKDCMHWFQNTPLDELCLHIAATPLCFQPGTHFLYGLNSDILGRVVEIASNGQSFDAFCMQHIFQPLQMKDTRFGCVSEEDMHRFARCYEVDPVTKGAYRVCDREDKIRDQTPKFISGGGGVLSTLSDYERFSRCLLNKGELDGVRILSEHAVSLMTINQLPNNALLSDMLFGDMFSELKGGPFGYGFGVYALSHRDNGQGCGLSNPGEFGWGGVASTFFYVDPVSQISVVLMTQLIPSAANLCLRTQLRWLTHWMVQPTED